MDIVGLSEMRRPGSGEISSRGFTYYWSGMSIGLAICISSRLQSSIVEVTLVDAIEAEAHLGLKVSCCSVHSY